MATKYYIVGSNAAVQSWIQSRLDSGPWVTELFVGGVNLTAIRGSDPNNVWAVGQDGAGNLKVYYSTGDGNWSEIVHGLVGAANGGAAGGELWVLSSTVLITVGTSSWAKQVNGVWSGGGNPTGIQQSIHGHDLTQMWVGNGVWSYWNGSIFTTQVGLPGIPTSLWAIGPGDVFGFANRFAYHNSGAYPGTWSSKDLLGFWGNKGEMHLWKEPSSNKLWAAGTSGQIGSHNGTWNAGSASGGWVNEGTAGTLVFRDIWGVSPTNIVAAGGDHLGIVPTVYQYNGSVWTQIHTGLETMYVRGVWGTSSSTLGVSTTGCGQYGQDQYGKSQFGNCGAPQSDVILPTVATAAELDAELYLQEIAFPLRFTEKGDVVLINNDGAVNDSIKLAAFVRKNGIPLMPLGAGMDEFPFDPLDFPFKAFMGYRLKSSIELGVKGIRVDNNLTFTESESNVKVAVRYLNERTSEVQSAILAVPRFRTDQ
jgi:hypothetical protein